MEVWSYSFKGSRVAAVRTKLLRGCLGEPSLNFKREGEIGGSVIAYQYAIKRSSIFSICCNAYGSYLTFESS